MSSLLQVMIGGAGVFAVGLGVAHLWVPRIFAFGRAIGVDGSTSSSLGSIGIGRWRYERCRADALGLAWVAVLVS